MKPQFPVLLSALVLPCLLSCGDSGTSSPDPTQSGFFDGTWNHSVGDQTRQSFEFLGAKLHFRKVLYGCALNETWGTYSYADGMLHVSYDSMKTRDVDTSSTSYAQACVNPQVKATVSGTMPVALEAVTTTSFLLLESHLSIGTGATIWTTEKLLFQKQTGQSL